MPLRHAAPRSKTWSKSGVQGYVLDLPQQSVVCWPPVSRSLASWLVRASIVSTRTRVVLGCQVGPTVSGRCKVPPVVVLCQTEGSAVPAKFSPCRCRTTARELVGQKTFARAWFSRCGALGRSGMTVTIAKYLTAERARHPQARDFADVSGER